MAEIVEKDAKALCGYYNDIDMLKEYDVGEFLVV